MNSLQDLEKETVAPPKKPKRTATRLYKAGSLVWAAFILLTFIILGFQLGGFVRFVSAVAQPPATITQKADGIVVLTGGENRIATALELYSTGLAKRVLITGVNPELSQASLINLSKQDASLFECCIDVDRKAIDTIDNANQARKWASKNDFKSLIVVTGAFHMPRAMLEFSHAMADVRLIPYPVNTPREPQWWENGSRLRDLIREYMKLSFVRLRDQVNQATGNSWPAMLFRQERPVPSQ